MTDLDKSLRDLIAAHGLLNIGIDAHAGSDGLQDHFSISLQWADDAKPSGRGCVIGSGDTSRSALERALILMAAKRSTALVGELAA